uniref:Uncharacterized protein n=1 Tax=Helianthus annuus TaxID=4232 RepID=A0A251SM85_HELAN
MLKEPKLKCENLLVVDCRVMHAGATFESCNCFQYFWEAEGTQECEKRSRKNNI